MNLAQERSQAEPQLPNKFFPGPMRTLPPSSWILKNTVWHTMGEEQEEGWEGTITTVKLAPMVELESITRGVILEWHRKH